jgi:hypothetical protein
MACNDSTPPRGAGWEPGCIRTIRAKIESAGALWCIVVVVAPARVGRQGSVATANRGLPAKWV